MKSKDLTKELREEEKQLKDKLHLSEANLEASMQRIAELTTIEEPKSETEKEQPILSRLWDIFMR